MDINTDEKLMITDIDELEQDVEYYIKFYKDYLYFYNGIYKVVTIKSKSINLLNNAINNYIKLKPTKRVWFLKPPFKFDDNIRNHGHFIETSNDINTICNIYKLPINDYILK